MPRRRENTWYQKAAELIVREGRTPWQAFNEVGEACTQSEAEEIHKSRAFQQTLWAERQRFQKEIARTPGRDKDASLGLLILLVQKLIDAGEFDKAIVGLEKLMKAEGHTGTDQNVNIFAGLSPKDYAQLKAELESTQTGRGTGTTSPDRVN